MKRLFSQLHRPLRNERGEITFFACFFVVGVVMLISFLLLYASVRITCINIRNGAKMELNNLSATIYADTYRSQRETNFEEYLRTLYSSRDYTEMLEATVAGGLAEKVPLSTDDYTVSDISLEFNVVGDRVEYIFYCDVDFYVRMFGHSYRHARTDFVTPCTIEKIIKLMRCAFHQAVRWDIIGKNPFEDAILPKREKKVRAIWTADIIRDALNHCSDGKLYVAINLAFACSMRMGEITGLTWDCVHISDEEIARDDAFVWIEKELARVDQKAINAVGEKDILFVFPRLMGGKSSTRLVLKKPKTESSIRKVWIPRTLAFILREWKEKQDKLKEFMGDDYIDYNLVLAQETGRPCEDRIIGNQFERLKKSAGLPNVVFHSLRHSSTTYKLKINKGDVKATQGDTGHAQSDMVTQVYAHILDEDRKVNAQKFEMAFYANADLRGVEQRLRAESAAAEPDSEILLKQLEAKPELMDAFTKKFVEQYGEQIMNQLAKKLIGA